jgi:hypothetical protein
MKGYPRWFVTVLMSALGVMFVSGLLLAPTTLAMRADIGLPWRLPGSGRVLTAALHAAGGFALTLLVGALWSVHMRSGWRRRRQRLSGFLLGSLLLALAASAVAVYYVGEETLGAATAIVHLALGLLLALAFGWHWVLGRRTHRRGHAPARAHAPHLPPHRHVVRPRPVHLDTSSPKERA